MLESWRLSASDWKNAYNVQLFSQETQQKKTIAEKHMANGEICFAGKCYHHCFVGEEGNMVLKKQSF